MAALEMLVPADIEKHLFLNKFRIKTYDSMLQEIEQIPEVMTSNAKVLPINAKDAAT